ncbi:MAG: polysaccharide biosynthesis C-terminal domain-containing protein [Gemmatimonadaceae bacterium]|nr:polysaccharide biosynthesis C-terminal domain-containing protein [Gemmatimonadaceae bacterium]
MTLPIRPARGPLSNFIALGTGELIARAAGFLATALLARRLGVESFGVLGFATATIAYFGLALTGGFGAISAREVARRPADAKQIAADATAVRLILAVCGTVGVTIVSLYFVESPVRRTVLMLTSLSLLPLALDTGWAYRGLGRNHIVGFGLVAAQSLYLAGALLLVHDTTDLERVPLLQLVGDVVAAAILLLILFRGGVPRPSIARGLNLLRQSGFITVGRLLRAVIVTFDVILLGIIASDRDVGLYTAAYRVCFLAITIAVSTHTVFLPAVTRATLSGATAIGPVVARSLYLTTSVIIPIVAGGIVLAAPLLAFLFGPEYAAGAGAFQILLASIGLLALHGASHNVFVALDRNGLEAVIFGLAAILNVVLNLLLIPRFGLAGAASATLAAEGLILIAAAIALHRLGVRPAVRGLVRPTGAAAIMAAVIYSVAGQGHVILLVAAGAGIYVGLLAMSGGFPKEFSEPVSPLEV